MCGEEGEKGKEGGCIMQVCAGARVCVYAPHKSYALSCESLSCTDGVTAVDHIAVDHIAVDHIAVDHIPTEPT